MQEYPCGLHNVALYLRKSRADLDAEARGEGDTLSRHKTALLTLARKYEYEILDTYEEIVSGERILDRPKMQELLHAVESKRYSGVLCMDLDRLGRGNMVDQGIIQETFKSSRTLIITPRKVYDLQDELDEEWSEFEAFMARRELKIITRRLQRGRRQSASLGKSISRTPPYGYLRDTSLRLYPNPDTAPVVRLIFQLSAEGWGITRICKHLTSLGIPTPTRRRVWDRSSVYAILRNPVYLGQIVWGRLRYEKKSDSPGKYNRLSQSRENWIVAEQAHEPLVDLDTYERYQNALLKRPRVGSHRELVNPLATLLYCAECGKSLRRQPTSNRPHNRLLCTTPGCPTKSVSFELVEQRILQELRALFGGLTVPVDALALTGAVSQEHLRPVLLQRLHAVKQQLADLYEQRATLHDLLEKQIYDLVTFTERKQILDQRLSAAEREQRRLKEETANLDHALTVAMQILPRRVGVIQTYELTQDVKLKNRLLKTLIEKVIYKRNTHSSKPDQFELEIFLRF